MRRAIRGSMSDRGDRPTLHEAEIRILERCADGPKRRMDFSGLDRMVLQTLHMRAWLQRTERDGEVVYGTTPAGLVALGVARLTAAE